MTTASSTSQSVFSLPRGTSTVSSGPTTVSGAFMNRIGSCGMRGAGLGCVVVVVQPDAHDLADPGQRRADPQPRPVQLR